ncbi:HotDog domain-containing protein [Coemansia mojavensis]|nr:HotDog domain-containing protein [Coemansia mojavensis]
MQHIDDLLVLEQTEGMAFVSDNLWGTPVTPSAFGGQLVALSLAAAFKTVPENYLARSLHAQFIDSVDKTKPAIFKVNDQAPGSRVTSRMVQCFQEQRLAMQTVCSFVARKPRTAQQADYRYQKGMPDVALPGSTSDCPFVLDPQGYPKAFPAMIWVTELDRDHATPAPPRQQMWLECPDKQQRSEQAKQCIVAMYSDVHFTRVIVRPYGIRIAPPPRHLRKIVSIDHHMWFHQEADPNNPILVDTWCSQLSSGRGVVQSEMFAHDRRLVATIMQEGRVEIDPSAQLPSPKL